MALNVTTDLGANNLVGNGSTDNLAHYNAAVAALTAPYTLYWPAGTYNFTATPTTIPPNVTWYGDGKNQTVINGTRTSVLSDAVLSFGDSVTLRDLHITTPDTANAVNQCLTSAGAVNLVLERVKFSNAAGTGLRAAGATQVFMTECEFTNIYRIGSSSLISGSLVNSSIVNCWFHHNNPSAGVNTQHCIYLNGTPSAVSISGCVFQSYGGYAVEIHGNAGVTFGNAISVTGCVFVDGPFSFGAFTSQTVYGVQFNSNTLYLSSGNGLVFYSTQNFAVCGNVCTLLVAGATFAALVSDGSFDTANGLFSGNAVAYHYSAASFGAGIQIYQGLNINIVNNTFTGLYLGVGIQGASSIADISVTGNQFLFPPGWTNPGGGGYYFGNAATLYGVAVDGAVTNLQVVDNKCQQLTYELFFTKFTYTGQADSVRFRSASWPGSNTHVFGFQNAAPTNCSQLSAPSTPFSASNTAHAYTTPTT